MVRVINPLLLVALFALVSLIGGMPTSPSPGSDDGSDSKGNEDLLPGSQEPADDSDDEEETTTKCYPGSEELLEDNIEGMSLGSGGESGLSEAFVVTRDLLKTLPGRPKLDLTLLNDSVSTKNSVPYSEQARSYLNGSILDTLVKLVKRKHQFRVVQQLKVLNTAISVHSKV